ncbi:heat shock protein 67B1-like [Drosophila obscura]|uniref:heat shock protein 67B1-like n=1 Tax=Drosophila obscura TaxID=7282 RepID=UPI001BB1F01A|nr:heat shock protein 67B1-like [Drosophila obscura]
MSCVQSLSLFTRIYITSVLRAVRQPQRTLQDLLEEDRAQFSTRELTVRTIDNCIVVEGQHDEKEDGHGVISRHFIRKYMLPKSFDPAEVHSTLSSDGILTVKAPPPPTPANKAGVERLERIVDIQQLLQSQLQPKDAQTPKPVPTEAHAHAEAESKSVAAPTPTAGAAAAAAATPESNGNGQAEAETGGGRGSN